MRPVNKPYPEHDPIVTGYQLPGEQVRTALQDTIGFYCSFCEMPVKLEYGVASKTLREPSGTPAMKDWNDLLLACDYCLVHRRSDAFDLSFYLWPDVDTTFSLVAPSPFVYSLETVTVVVIMADGKPVETTEQLVIVSPNPLAGGDAEKKALRTIDLFQLNSPFYDPVEKRYTLTIEEALSGVDERVWYRTDAWQEAILAAEELAATDTPSFRRAMSRILTRLAQNVGFWSTWITAFAAAGVGLDQISSMLLQTSDPQGYVLTGYQTYRSAPWTTFTGTAIDRLIG